MSLIRWQDSFNIGIDVIDSQHQTLVKYVNELADAIDGTCPSVNTTFAKLVAFTKVHFHTEEQFFSCLSKSDKLLHKLQHKHILEQLDYLLAESRRERLSDNIYYDLLDWFVIHIQCEDIKLTAPPNKVIPLKSKHEQ